MDRLVVSYYMALSASWLVAILQVKPQPKMQQLSWFHARLSAIYYIAQSATTTLTIA